MNTSQLIGAPLDYWVAMCLELEQPRIYRTQDGAEVCEYLAPADNGFAPNHVDFKPSTDWADCGPLIDRYQISLRSGSRQYECDLESGGLIDTGYGANAQLAVCRAVVLSKYGDEVSDDLSHAK